GGLRGRRGGAGKKAIVDKSRVEANRLRSPAFVFRVWVSMGILLSKCGFWQHIGPPEAGGLGIDPAQQQPGKPDFKLLLLNGFEADRPPRQTRTDKESVVGPVDFAILVDSARDHLWIVQLLDSAPISTSRMLIKFARTTHTKGLVGALLVKLLAPQFQAILIDSAQTLELQADIAMQTFVGPIVLRMPGAASL